jgi:hypothetical protein
MVVNMQFLDDTLDIKFIPSFLVFTSQGKLFLAAFSTWAYHKPYWLLSVSFLMFVAFGVVNYLSQPCIIKRINIWTTAIYATAAWICVAGFVTELTANGTTGLIVAAVGTFLIWGATAALHNQRWGGYHPN